MRIRRVVGAMLLATVFGSLVGVACWRSEPWWAPLACIAASVVITGGIWLGLTLLFD